MSTWKSQRLQRELDLFGFPEFSCQFQLHNDTQVSDLTSFFKEINQIRTAKYKFLFINIKVIY
jgi:hypothetical protein